MKGAFMKRALMAFVIITLLPAFAQAVDIRPRPTAGVYSIRVMAPPEEDVAQVCLDQVDDATGAQIERLACAPAQPNEIVTFSVTIPVSPGHDKTIRAKAIDFSGNESEYSDDKATIDFTPPGKPSFLSI
jgi:hypothetical protein